MNKQKNTAGHAQWAANIFYAAFTAKLRNANIACANISVY